MSRIVWTTEEIEFLRENCRTMTAAAIGKALGRTQRSVERMKNIQGLSRRYFQRDKELDDYPAEAVKRVIRTGTLISYGNMTVHKSA